MNPTYVSTTIATLMLALSADARVRPSDIHPERELLITHPSVTDSEFAKYPGPWSFGSLVEAICGKEAAGETIRLWLEQYALGGEADRKKMTDAEFLEWIRRAGSKLPEKKVAKREKGKLAPAPPRPAIWAKLIEPWQRRDGFDPTKGESWKPNLANAPFRLLAIVNRVDLVASELVDLQTPVENAWTLRGRKDEMDRMLELAGLRSTSSKKALFSGSSGGYGGGSSQTEGQTHSAGEGRLVFGAIDTGGKPLEGGWTIIFEYELSASQFEGFSPFANGSKKTPSGAQRWAAAWHRLGEFALDDHRYNEALAELTKMFTHRRQVGNLRFLGHEGTFLKQLRSNEGAFGPGRVFQQFNPSGVSFVADPLPMTPAVEYMDRGSDEGRELARFLDRAEPLIEAGLHQIPSSLGTRPLAATFAVIPAGAKDFHWEVGGAISRNSRRLFSVNTCNGCHAGDTACDEGMHIHPRIAGEAARLSSFLRADGKPNRFQDPGLKSAWVKQEEMADRVAILAALLEPRESRRIDALEDTLRGRLRRGH